MLSLITNWKVIGKWAIILALLSLIAVSVKTVIDRENQRDQALESARAALVEKEKAVDAYKSANEYLQRKLAQQEQARKAAETAVAEVTEDFVTARKERDDQKRVFEENNLDKLLQAKPGLIELKANKATDARFKELEGLLR